MKKQYKYLIMRVSKFNWIFPFLNSQSIFAYLQLSSGYGDSLIDYNQEVNRISFGLSLSR